MAIKALVTGDLHLGKRSRIDDHADDTLSTRHTWNTIVDWCTSNSIDLMLLTGDIVDRDNKFFEAVGPLKAGFAKNAGIPVYMVSGNHDYDVLQDIAQTACLDNVHLLGKWENGNVKYMRMLWGKSCRYWAGPILRST